jgi:hypothetical protein
VSKNLHRRHLNASQRAMIADEMANMKQGARKDLTEISVKSVPSVSQVQAATLLQVNQKTASDARTVKAKGTMRRGRRLTGAVRAAWLERAGIASRN